MLGGGNEMEWKLSQQSEKIIFSIIYPLTLLIFFILLYFFTGKFVDAYIYVATMSVFGIGITIFVYFAGKYVSVWDYPIVVKIENNCMRYLKFDRGNKIYIDIHKPIDFNSIYQIVIKDKSFQMYYYLDDGKKYLTGFAIDGFFIRHITKDREKRLEILNEVLKRIDKEKVKIIDKRKRKNFKISGGDR